VYTGILGGLGIESLGVFSGLNKLTDLLNRPAYSDALGITEEELTTYFALYITRLAKVEG
jgi:hypothetical protein